MGTWRINAGHYHFYRLVKILGVDLNYFSESFQSMVSEKAQVELTEKKSVELSSGKQNRKRNWDMSRGNWVDADFSGLNNLNEKFSSSNMQRCLFIDSDLSGILLKNNHVNGCDFSRADMTRVVIKSSDFSKNTIVNVVWNHTFFINTQLTEIVFEGAIEDCYFENCTFSRVQFRNVTIMDIFFKCKSLKRIQFIDCKADRMTYAFLKNGKQIYPESHC